MSVWPAAIHTRIPEGIGIIAADLPLALRPPPSRSSRRLCPRSASAIRWQTRSRSFRERTDRLAPDPAQSALPRSQFVKPLATGAASHTAGPDEALLPAQPLTRWRLAPARLP